MKTKLIVYSLLIILFIAITLYGSYYLNDWRGHFWQQINDKEIAGIWVLVLQFTVAAFILIYSGAAQTWFQSKLALKIREYLTHKFTDKYLKHIADHKDYHGQMNPDQRIAEDIRLLTSNGLSLLTGTIFSVCKAAIFIGVLYMFSVQIYGQGGYIPLGSLAYAVIGTLIAYFIGKKLVSLTFDNQNTEADYRRGLIFIRTADGNDDKHKDRFNSVIFNSLRLFNRQKLLNLWIGSYDQASVILPILVLLPAYMINPAFTFGMLMQVVNAVAELVAALSFLTNNWNSVTDLKACYNRINGFNKVLEKKACLK